MRAAADGTLARRGSNLLLQLLHAAIHGGDAAERAYRDVLAAFPLAAAREARRLLATPYSRRSATIFLISAIALPGFRSFGHACVQFRIVWQR